MRATARCGPSDLPAGNLPFAVAAYARQAKDSELIAWATEIKVRAERRTGELLSEMNKLNGARGVGKKVASSRSESTPKLKELGMSHNQSSTWQQLAKIPEPEFERRRAKASAHVEMLQSPS
jgi:hypothetical protein